KNTINTMVDQLSSFASEVTRVAREVGTEGKLGGQADVRGGSGTFLIGRTPRPRPPRPPSPRRRVSSQENVSRPCRPFKRHPDSRMYCRARACPGVFGVEDQGADHSGRLAEVVHEGVEIARGTDRHVDLPQLVLIAVATAFCCEAYRTPQLGP